MVLYAIVVASTVRLSVATGTAHPNAASNDPPIFSATHASNGSPRLLPGAILARIGGTIASLAS